MPNVHDDDAESLWFADESEYMTEPEDGAEWLNASEPRHPDAYEYGEPWGPDNPAHPGPGANRERGNQP